MATTSAFSRFNRLFSRGSSFHSNNSKRLFRLSAGLCAIGSGLYFTRERAYADGKTGNRVFGWGMGQHGQLGNFDEKSSTFPIEIGALSHVDPTHLSAGTESVAVLTKNGELWTFGRGQSFALGHGDSASLDGPKLVDFSLTHKLKTIETSGNHSLAIDENGRVYSWGRVALGREGSGNLPDLVGGELEGKFVTKVACGKFHSLAITREGKVYAWGQGREGALGLGQKEDKSTPTLVSLLADVKIVQVAGGISFSLFLSESGEVYSCGISDYGQCGLGTTDKYVLKPTKIRALSGKKVTQIAAGDYHAACLTSDGEVYAWGFGSEGQCGNGTTKLHNTSPGIVESLIGKKIVAVDCGGAHTAAIDDAGTLWIWGKGRDGQLGRGDQLESPAAYRAEPVVVEFFRKKNLKVQEVALGKDFSLAIAK